jgi:hypothetical protein
MGALSRGGQAWLELVVGGETLSPRERLVAVPFALRAGVANGLIEGHKIALLSSNNSPTGIGYAKNNNEYSKFTTGTSGKNGDVSRLVFIPKNISHLELNLSFRARGANTRVEIPANAKIPYGFKATLGQKSFNSAGIGYRLMMDSPPTGWQRLDLFSKRKNKNTGSFFLFAEALELMAISLIGTVK